MVIWITIVVVWLISNALIGAICLRMGERRAAAAADRLLRLDPPRRTAGAPTNADAEPSSPRQPKWRSGTFKSGPPQP